MVEGTKMMDVTALNRSDGLVDSGGAMSGSMAPATAFPTVVVSGDFPE